MERDNEMPEMWFSRIRIPFKNILEANPQFFSKNQILVMRKKPDFEKLRGWAKPRNYAYCTVCDSLVFLPEIWDRCPGDHLKGCIARTTEVKPNVVEPVKAYFDSVQKGSKQ